MKLYSNKLNKYFNNINLFLTDDELLSLYNLLNDKSKDNSINYKFVGLDINNQPTKKILIKIES